MRFQFLLRDREKDAQRQTGERRKSEKRREEREREENKIKRMSR